jgi:hypothetical protein
MLFSIWIDTFVGTPICPVFVKKGPTFSGDITYGYEATWALL